MSALLNSSSVSSSQILSGPSFYKSISSRSLSRLVVGGSVLTGSSLIASASYAEVPTEVTTGIANAKDTVEALEPLALSALSVALIPLGLMLTLRFLNMVLSRV